MNAVLTWLADRTAVIAVLNYLGTRPAWAVYLAVGVLALGLWAATLIRIAEILADEDTPIPVPVPVVAAAPVTLDLGLYGPDLDALEATS